MANFEASMPPAWTLCSINPNNSLVFFWNRNTKYHAPV
jgi:hypothetical protein